MNERVTEVFKNQSVGRLRVLARVTGSNIECAKFLRDKISVDSEFLKQLSDHGKQFLKTYTNQLRIRCKINFPFAHYPQLALLFDAIEGQRYVRCFNLL